MNQILHIFQSNQKPIYKTLAKRLNDNKDISYLTWDHANVVTEKFTNLILKGKVAFFPTTNDIELVKNKLCHLQPKLRFNISKRTYGQFLLVFYYRKGLSRNVADAFEIM